MFVNKDTHSSVTVGFYAVKIFHFRLSFSQNIGLPGVRVEKGGALLTQVLLPHTHSKPWKKENEGVKPL